MTLSARLLLIDDDTRLTAMLGDYLRAAGFAVESAATLAAGRALLAALAASSSPESVADTVLLDPGLVRLAADPSLQRIHVLGRRLAALPDQGLRGRTTP